MERPAIKAEARSLGTKHSVKTSRKKGVIPCVIYGKKVGNMPISVDEKELYRVGGAHLIDVKLPEGSYPVIIREIQKHPISGKVIHVDFLQVDMDQKIKAEIPVQLVGTAVGQKDGGILQHGVRAVEIEALPDQLPDALEVDISELGIGDKFTVADLQKTTPLTITSDPESFIVLINAPKMEEEEPAAEEEPGAADTAEEPAGEE